MSRSPIYQIRITLKGSKPPIWRKLTVPSDIVLGELHELIQIAMGWTESHLHQFRLRDKGLKPSPQEGARRFQQDAWDDEFLGRMRGERVFVTKVTPWGDPTDLEGEDEEAVTLAGVCPTVKSKRRDECLDGELFLSLALGGTRGKTPARLSRRLVHKTGAGQTCPPARPGRRHCSITSSPQVGVSFRIEFLCGEADYHGSGGEEAA